jgi:hypothetical protein
MKNQNISMQDHPQKSMTNSPASIAKGKANAFALAMKPIIENLHAEGVSSPSALATALIRLNVDTARGGQWNTTLVLNLLRRLEVLICTEEVA